MCLLQYWNNIINMKIFIENVIFMKILIENVIMKILIENVIFVENIRIWIYLNFTS